MPDAVHHGDHQEDPQHDDRPVRGSVGESAFHHRGQDDHRDPDRGHGAHFLEHDHHQGTRRGDQDVLAEVGGHRREVVRPELIEVLAPGLHPAGQLRNGLRQATRDSDHSEVDQRSRAEPEHVREPPPVSDGRRVQDENQQADRDRERVTLFDDHREPEQEQAEPAPPGRVGAQAAVEGPQASGGQENAVDGVPGHHRESVQVGQHRGRDQPGTQRPPLERREAGQERGERDGRHAQLDHRDETGREHQRRRQREVDDVQDRRTERAHRNDVGVRDLAVQDPPALRQDETLVGRVEAEPPDPGDHRHRQHEDTGDQQGGPQASALGIRSAAEVP